MNNFLKKYSTIKINCPGGILSPGRLLQIISVLDQLHIEYIRFGLRQCIFIDLHHTLLNEFTQAMAALALPFNCDDTAPNVLSAYPVEELFPTTPWLSEGVYKDILDTLEGEPLLKINISDSAQSLTPLFTGNINWVASPMHPHYWHLYIRFPKTNELVKWNSMIYTNELMRFSKILEDYVLLHPSKYIDQPGINPEAIRDYMNSYDWISIPGDEELPATVFTMPYYEGFNRYGDRYWLGIYKRNEKYALSFLKDISLLCLETRIGQICITPWKSIIIKSISPPDRSKWNHILNQHLINVRHPLNELNFQVEDNSKESLNLKKYLVKQFNEDDLRTQGICFGIKTRPKSEVFCNVLIKKRYHIRLGRLKVLSVYDIMISHEFNPNERTGYIYAKGLFKYLLPDHLMACLTAYFKNRTNHFTNISISNLKPETKKTTDQTAEYVYQCDHCLTWMEGEFTGEDKHSYLCSVCEAPGIEFSKVNKEEFLIS